MKILEVIHLNIPDAKVVEFGTFEDARGFFSEPFRQSDMKEPEVLDSFEFPVAQAMESYSRKMVMRGMHLQWKASQ